MSREKRTKVYNDRNISYSYNTVPVIVVYITGVIWFT